MNKPRLVARAKFSGANAPTEAKVKTDVMSPDAEMGRMYLFPPHGYNRRKDHQTIDDSKGSRIRKRCGPSVTFVFTMIYSIAALYNLIFHKSFNNWLSDSCHG